MGIVENPYPMFALVRPDNPMKREGIEDPVLVPEGADIDFMQMDRSADIFTAYSFEAVQQVSKDGHTLSSAGYAAVMGKVRGHSPREMEHREPQLAREVRARAVR